MRTSLIEIKKLEDLILNSGDHSERLVTEAKALIDPDLREMVQLQKKSYELIRLYGRNKLRGEIEEVERLIFREPKFKFFQNTIRSIFK